MQSTVQSFWMLLAGFFYTLLAVCIKLCVDDYSVFEIVFYRSAIGMVMAVYLLRKAGQSIKTPHVKLHVLRNVLIFANLCLGAYITWLMPLSMAQIFNSSCPMFLALCIVVQSLLMGERIVWGMVGALLTGFLGVVLVVQPTMDWSVLSGMAIGITVAASGGCADFTVTKLGERGESPQRILFWFLASCLVASFIATLVTGGFHALTLEGALCLFGIGIFGTLGQYVMTIALKYGVPLLNSVLQFSGLVFSVIVSIVWFDDIINSVGFVGIALIILSGIAASVLSFRAKLARLR